MLTETPKKTYTLEEYRQLEESAEFRNEYQDGEIIAMTGGSINHNRIIGNIFAYLKFALRAKNAEVFMTDLRLWIPRYRRGTYPDVMVISGEPVFNEKRNDEILNPSLIIEVLSKSTQEYDKADKFRFYRSIPEFSEYLLVSQYEFYVEQYIKNNSGQWLFQEYEGEESIVRFNLAGVEMSLKEIYEKVNFEVEES
ncbi:MAG TPA: Uma2 family endonuclease [Halomicronema sp.]